MGKARAAYVHMDMVDSLDYEKVKAAILANINSETYCLQFRSTELKELNKADFITWNIIPSGCSHSIILRRRLERELFWGSFCPHWHLIFKSGLGNEILALLLKLQA
jgi:hypothetical protein